MPYTPLCILAECGRRGRSNHKNCHCWNEIIGKFPALIVLRRDMCEEGQSGHPGGTMEAAVGVCCERAQETVAEGV